jgi:hypothetical protein
MLAKDSTLLTDDQQPETVGPKVLLDHVGQVLEQSQQPSPAVHQAA